MDDCFKVILGFIPFEKVLPLSIVCQKWNNLIRDNKKEYFFNSDFSIFHGTLVINKKVYRWKGDTISYFSLLDHIEVSIRGNSLQMGVKKRLRSGTYNIVKCANKIYYNSEGKIYLMNLHGIKSLDFTGGNFIWATEMGEVEWVSSNSYSYLEYYGDKLIYHSSGIKKVIKVEGLMYAKILNDKILMQFEDSIVVYDVFDEEVYSKLKAKDLEYFSVNEDYMLLVCKDKVYIEGDGELPEKLKFISK